MDNIRHIFFLTSIRLYVMVNIITFNIENKNIMADSHDKTKTEGNTIATEFGLADPNGDNIMTLEELK